MRARSERISALLEMCYKLLDCYESSTLVTAGSTTVCMMGHSSQECDSLVYGCLIKGLQSLKLFPKRVEVSEVEASVAAFARKLRSLKCFEYPDSHSTYQRRYDSYETVTHSECGFTLAFADQIKAIIGGKEPSGVLDEHLAHIDEQKE